MIRFLVVNKGLSYRALVVFLLIGLFGYSQFSYAIAEIKGVRLWRAPEKTRLVFDMSDGIEHHIFTLSSPNRVVIDLKNTDLTDKLAKIDL